MTTTIPSNPNALAEKWLTARLGTDGGFRADAIIAHGKGDGHSEAALREAHKKLGFVQFAEPGTGRPVWSSFMHCMAPDVDGKVVWAEPVAKTTTQSARPAAAAAAPPSSTAVSYRPPAPAAVAPRPPALSNAQLRERVDAHLWRDECRGREPLALAMIAQSGFDADKIVDALRAAPKVLTEHTWNLGNRIRALAWCKESDGREAMTLHLIEQTSISAEAAIEALRAAGQDLPGRPISKSESAAEVIARRVADCSRFTCPATRVGIPHKGR